jgi:hypothetical protein
MLFLFHLWVITRKYPGVLCRQFLPPGYLAGSTVVKAVNMIRAGQFV